jgi:hypothetical protein
MPAAWEPVRRRETDLVGGRGGGRGWEGSEEPEWGQLVKVILPQAPPPPRPDQESDLLGRRK